MRAVHPGAVPQAAGVVRISVAELVKVGPKGYVHGWIKVGDATAAVKVFGQHKIITASQESKIRDALRNHENVSPGVVSHISGVSTSSNLHQRSTYDADGLCVYNKKYDRSSILISSRLMMRKNAFEFNRVIDHEIGHASAHAAFGSSSTPQDDEFWRRLAKSLGISVIPDRTSDGGVSRASADAWLHDPEVRAGFQKIGYPYALDNVSEMAADMWREFVSGNAKEPARVYGNHVRSIVDNHHISSITKGASDLHDPNPVDAEHVYQQLLQNYPPDSVSWVRDMPWIGPIEIPLDRIDWDGKDSWAASHQKKRVKRFVKRIHNGGEDVHPIVGVQVPGDDRVKVIDGHHRALAFQKEGKPAKAYVGFAPSNDSDSPWFQAHLYQKKKGADPANKAETWLVFGEYGSHGKLKVRLADLLKVGPEGYIHGYICVRPPCGPRYAQAKFDSGKGTVLHGDNAVRVGKMRKNEDGTYSMMHHAGDAKSKLTARYASRKDAAESIALYHNVAVLHNEATQAHATSVVPHLDAARDALASGDRNGAVQHLGEAEAEAKVAGNTQLRTHIADTKAAVEHGPEPVHGTGSPVPESVPEPTPAPVPVPKPAPAPEVPVQQPSPEVPVLHEVPAKTGRPFVPAMPKRSSSHTKLDAAEIQAEAQQLAEDGKNIPGVEWYSSPLNSMRNLADSLKRDIGKSGDSERLYPHDGKLGNEVIPAQALKSIEWDMALTDRMLTSGRIPYSGDKPLTRAALSYLKDLRSRMQVLHDKVAAADTSDPFIPGGFTSGMFHAPQGDFEAHLTSKEADELHRLIGDTNLQFPKRYPKDREDTSSDVADRMDHLKTKFVESSLKKAGLPDNAAYILAGGTKAQSYDQGPDGDLPNGLGVARMMGDWTLTGDNAQDVVDMFKRSDAMTEPPAIRVTDFAGARRGSLDQGWVYSDMSPEAIARRSAATDYWVPRAQQHYTNQVMKDVTSKPTLKAVRFVFGQYGKNIIERQDMGMPWTAHDRGMSSWAEPKGARSSQAFVRMFVPDEPGTVSYYSGRRQVKEKPKFVKLTTDAPVSKVVAHWRGEGVLRNGVKALGEVILKDPVMNEKTTKAEYVQ